MYDLIGIGFGPANLALAIALDDHNRMCEPRERIEALFLESRESFDWHPGMMLPGATMQISFLKDLVTFRDATHPLSFLAYAQACGRLADFVNKQTFFATRREFAGYLSWAAGHVGHLVRYGSRVTRVDVTPGQGYATVSSADGARFEARTVVHAPGLVPLLPPEFASSARVFHTHDLLGSLARLPHPVRSALVVGSGQSAAEAARHLHDSDPARVVHAVFAKVGYTPADDSPYANRIFDAAMVDRWHAAEPDVRERLHRYHRGTNYSAVDPDLIEDLYAGEYDEIVTGPRRLHVHNCSEITDCANRGDGVRLVVRDLTTGQREELDVDAVVLATGYRGADPADLFGSSARWYATHEGRPEVERDYRWRPRVEQVPAVYLNGGVEHTHGLTSSLLSNLPVRAAEILEGVLSARTPARLAVG